MKKTRRIEDILRQIWYLGGGAVVHEKISVVAAPKITGRANKDGVASLQRSFALVSYPDHEQRVIWKAQVYLRSRGARCAAV